LTPTRGVCVWILAIASLLLGVAPAGAQSPHLSPAGGARFPARAFVLALPTPGAVSADRLQLRENGETVGDVSLIAGDRAGQRAFGTVLVIDTSESMRGRPIAAAMHAARSFARRRKAGQPLAVVLFNNRTRVQLPITNDGSAIRNALARLPYLAPQTHIYDATARALRVLREGKIAAGAIVVLSDGSDTGSTQPEASVVRAARDAHVRIFAVGLRNRSFQSTTLTRLARATGGRYAEASTPSQLASIYDSLGSTLANEYLITYRSFMPLGEKVHVSAQIQGIPGVARVDYTTKPLRDASLVRRKHEPVAFADTTTGELVISLLGALLLGFAVRAATAPRRSVRSRVGQFTNAPAPDDEREWTSALLQRVFGDSKSSGERNERSAKLAQDLEIAGIELTVEGAAFWSIAASVLVGWFLATTLGGAAALLALVIPVVIRRVILSKAQQKRKAFDEQLPDNLQVMTSAMRAGHTFVGALAVVLEDTPEPSRREFRRILADEQLGVPLTEALQRVADRMESREFERVALVTTLQRESGGNTAEVMDSLTETIREKMELRRMLRTLTAQGRMTRWVVSSLPLGLLALITLINPTYVRPLYHSAFGISMLVVAGVMLFIGSQMIKRVVEIKE